MQEEKKVSGSEILNFIKDVLATPAIGWYRTNYTETVTETDDSDEIKLLKRKIKLLEKQNKMLITGRENPKLVYKVVKEK